MLKYLVCRVAQRSKGAIALAELDRAAAAGVRFGMVLADAGYGASAAFRHGLDAGGLRWAVGIPRNQKVYDLDVQLVPPTGRSRKPVPDQEPRAADDVLAERAWRRVTWRGGTKGVLTARFAALRVRVADGPVWANNRHLPGAEVWLVGEVSPGSCRAKLDGMADGGEWRSSGERKYYLSNLPHRLSMRALAAAIKARWVCEQAHSNSRKNWAWGTLKAAPGPVCTATP